MANPADWNTEPVCPLNTATGTTLTFADRPAETRGGHALAYSATGDAMTRHLINLTLQPIQAPRWGSIGSLQRPAGTARQPTAGLKAAERPAAGAPQWPTSPIVQRRLGSSF